MRTIYWLRFAYRKGTEQETTHVAEFPSENSLNGALMHLHRYEGATYTLASSGERSVEFHYKLQTPRQWTEFVRMRNFADDVVAAFRLPPPSAEARKAIAAMQAEASSHRAEARYPHYAQIRLALLVCSAALAVAAVTAVVRWAS